MQAPARSAVEYEVQVQDNSKPSPFRLGPGPEAESAWQRILDHHNVAVSSDDLKRINRTSVKLLNQEGYLSFLDFTHELHCLNYIRQSAYPEYYKLEAALRTEHTTHCLTSIMEILMCHGDISVHTFQMDFETGRIHPNPLIERECRRYEPLDKWNEAHQPVMGHGPILKNPFSNTEFDSEETNSTRAE
ncbi:hypothetical protein F4803DRAFT_578095 [Xylaria telfairii]|nr:hypothetical protein F4803DRAFT_578095 [Xylaria telfairii]